MNTWRGIAFEEICLLHTYQIKCALGVGQVASNQSNWSISGTDAHAGHQVDLIINRADRIVNMCEMKFYNDDFEVSSEYAKTIRNRMNTLIEHLSKKSSVQPTLVTSFGIKQGKNSGIFTKVVVLDDLFSE